MHDEMSVWTSWDENRLEVHINLYFLVKLKLCTLGWKHDYGLLQALSHCLPDLSAKTLCSLGAVNRTNGTHTHTEIGLEREVGHSPAQC